MRWLFLVALGLAVSEQASTQQPVFRSGVDVVAYDFTAVDGDGRPVTDLKAGEIALRVNGRPREVMSMEFVAAATLDETTITAAPPPYSSNARAVAPRTLIIAVDDEHLPVGEARGVLSDLGALLDQLAPGDRAGLIALKGAGTRVELTTDIGVVRDALKGVAGKEQKRFGQFSITATESIAILEGDRQTLERVVARECTSALSAGCPDQVRFEGESNGNALERSTRVAVESLRSLFENLAAVEGPKSVVLVSGGIFGTRRTRPLIEEAAEAAARARVSVFALQAFDALNDTTGGSAPANALREATLRGEGMQEVTDRTGGAFFRTAGSAKPAVARIAGELSGYYLLTFESMPGERGRQLQRIALSTTRAGVTLRARPRFAATPAASAGADPSTTRDALVRAPEPHRELPLRVAAYAQQGSEPGTVKLVVLADTPAGVPRSIPVTFALVTHDLKLGNQWTSALAARGEPPVPTATSVPAGRYRLRAAAIAEDGSRGTVEHAVNAALTDAGRMKVSDVILGAASGGNFSPRLDFARADGGAVAYVELYGLPDGDADDVTLTLERAGTSDGDALEVVPMTITPRGPAVHFATAGVAFDGLPDGDHVLRVIIEIRGVEAARLVRTLRITP